MQYRGEYKICHLKHGNRYRKICHTARKQKPKRKAGKKGGKTLTDAEKIAKNEAR
jgi:hypothetical protein